MSDKAKPRKRSNKRKPVRGNIDQILGKMSKEKLAEHVQKRMAAELPSEEDVREAEQDVGTADIDGAPAAAVTPAAKKPKTTAPAKFRGVDVSAIMQANNSQEMYAAMPVDEHTLPREGPRPDGSLGPNFHVYGPSAPADWSATIVTDEGKNPNFNWRDHMETDHRATLEANLRSIQTNTYHTAMLIRQAAQDQLKAKLKSTRSTRLPNSGKHFLAVKRTFDPAAARVGLSKTGAGPDVNTEEPIIDDGGTGLDDENELTRIYSHEAQETRWPRADFLDLLGVEQTDPPADLEVVYDLAAADEELVRDLIQENVKHLLVYKTHYADPIDDVAADELFTPGPDKDPDAQTPQGILTRYFGNVVQAALFQVSADYNPAITQYPRSQNNLVPLTEFVEATFKVETGLSCTCNTYPEFSSLRFRESTAPDHEGLAVEPGVFPFDGDYTTQYSATWVASTNPLTFHEWEALCDKYVPNLNPPDDNSDEPRLFWSQELDLERATDYEKFVERRDTLYDELEENDTNDPYLVFKNQILGTVVTTYLRDVNMTVKNSIVRWTFTDTSVGAGDIIPLIDNIPRFRFDIVNDSVSEQYTNTDIYASEVVERNDEDEGKVKLTYGNNRYVGKLSPLGYFFGYLKLDIMQGVKPLETIAVQEDTDEQVGIVCGVRADLREMVDWLFENIITGLPRVRMTTRTVTHWLPDATFAIAFGFSKLPKQEVTWAKAFENAWGFQPTSRYPASYPVTNPDVEVPDQKGPDTPDTVMLSRHPYTHAGQKRMHDAKRAENAKTNAQKAYTRAGTIKRPKHRSHTRQQRTHVDKHLTTMRRQVAAHGAVLTGDSVTVKSHSVRPAFGPMTQAAFGSTMYEHGIYRQTHKGVAPKHRLVHDHVMLGCAAIGRANRRFHRLADAQKAKDALEMERVTGEREEREDEEEEEDSSPPPTRSTQQLLRFDDEEERPASSSGAYGLRTRTTT